MSSRFFFLFSCHCFSVFVFAFRVKLQSMPAYNPTNIFARTRLVSVNALRAPAKLTGEYLKDN